MGSYTKILGEADKQEICKKCSENSRSEIVFRPRKKMRNTIFNRYFPKIVVGYPCFNQTVQCHHTVGELGKCHKKLEQSQSLLLLTNVDGDRLGQRCRLAP